MSAPKKELPTNQSESDLEPNDWENIGNDRTEYDAEQHDDSDEEEDFSEPLDDTTEEPTPNNPALAAFLQKWDRDLPPDRRCYGIKFCFAGAESKAIRDGLYRIGVRQILVSYFYFRKAMKLMSLQELAEDLGRFDYVFLDSGAFTFNKLLSATSDATSVREYAEEYYNTLPLVHHLFAGCAEVDVKTLGSRYMEEKKRQMLEKGVQIMPVVHGNRISEYENYGWFENFPYIALGSDIALDARYQGLINRLYSIGKKKGVVYHGFGCTHSNTLQRSRFYSVDSTTWLDGARFGTTMLFQNGRIRFYDHTQKEVRKRFKARFEEAGLIWANIEAEKGFEINMMNALAWKQNADYMRFAAQKSYWLTTEEFDAALTMKSKSFNSEGILDRTVSLARATARRLSHIENAEEDDRAHEILSCETCHMAGRCPRYKPGEACGYDVNVRLESAQDLQVALRKIIEVEYGRVMTAALFEKLEGGVLDKNLSGEMAAFLGMIGSVRNLYEPHREELTVRAKGGGAVSRMLSALLGDGKPQEVQTVEVRVEEEDKP